MSISFPEDDRVPLTVALRGPAAKGERPVRLTATIDRHDARVLSIVNFRETFFGFLHVFHENLTIPDYGRSIVGWTGAAMLTLSLTGLYLWWPRRGNGRAHLRGGAVPRRPLTCITWRASGSAFR
jgi:uncharacterized iron-regulated membrane protein